MNNPTDQLTRPERVRLECLAQAIASSMFNQESRNGSKEIIARALVYEEFLYHANEERGPSSHHMESPG